VKVRTPSGETVVARRLWLPWRQQVRDIDPGGADLSSGLDGIDDLGGLAFVLVLILLAILAPFIVVIFFAVAEFVLLLALLPLFIAARLGWAMTWTVLIRQDGKLLATRKVKGWTPSGVFIHEVARAAELGHSPLSISP
jgi:hypothetical protein